MPTHKKRTAKSGFTLAELLVVVAILAVLVAIAIPVFSSSTEKAKLAACQANRRSLLAELTYASMLEGLDQAGAEEILARYGDLCPSGGVISVTTQPSISVVCSAHQGSDPEQDPPEVIVSRTYFQTFTNYVTDPSHDPANILDAPWKKKKNDHLRLAFFHSNGERWPTLRTMGKEYQIEPYYSESSGESWLFARPKQSTPVVINAWNVPLLYNPKNGQWYEFRKANGTQDSQSVNYPSLDALIAALEKTQNNSRWHPLSAYEAEALD